MSQIGGVLRTPRNLIISTEKKARSLTLYKSALDLTRRWPYVRARDRIAAAAKLGLPRRYLAEVPTVRS
jgi:hypothetical protein